MTDGCPGADSLESAPSLGFPPPLHRGRFMPKKNLGKFEGQSPLAAGKAAAAGR